MLLKRILIALSLLTAVTTTATADDRQPTTEERTVIESVLKQEGFASWKEIELDDGKWEIDDAVHNDGRKYDLELDRTSLRIVSRDKDD